MRISYLLFFVLFLFSACKEELEKEVVQQYPNKKPMKVEHIKYLGDKRQVLKETRFYPNGNKEEEGGLSNGKRNGTWSFYKPDGFKWMEENYRNGVLHGEFTVWFRSGGINYQGEYTEGKPNGEWLFFKADGTESKRVMYDKGEKLSSENF